MGGNQEVVSFKPINLGELKLETFIKIETPYDNIFKQMVEQNIFGWLSKEEEHKMNFARFFANKGRLESVKISDYVLVNKDYKFYQK